MTALLPINCASPLLRIRFSSAPEKVLTNSGYPVRPLPQAFVQGGRQYLSSWREPGSSQKALPVARLGDNSQKLQRPLQIEVCHLAEKSR
jgi:hypothetical protein